MVCKRPPRLRLYKVASRYFIDGAATPPFQGGESIFPCPGSLFRIGQHALARGATSNAAPRLDSDVCDKNLSTLAIVTGVRGCAVVHGDGSPRLPSLSRATLTRRRG